MRRKGRRTNVNVSWAKRRRRAIAKRSRRRRRGNSGADAQGEHTDAGKNAAAARGAPPETRSTRAADRGAARHASGARAENVPVCRRDDGRRVAGRDGRQGTLFLAQNTPGHAGKQPRDARQDCSAAGEDAGPSDVVKSDTEAEGEVSVR